MVVKPIEVGGFSYPEGVCLVPNAYLVRHDPEIYEDPYAFRPQRFVDKAPGTYTWIPFGGGRRRCLGASFATLEMRIVLRAVLRERELEPIGDRYSLPRRRNIRSLRPTVPRSGCRRGRRCRWRPPSPDHRGITAPVIPRLDKRLDLTSAGVITLGACTTFPAVGFVFPAFGGSLKVNDTSGWVNGPVVVVYFALNIVVGTRITRGRVRAALRWEVEERAPNELEHRLTLGRPVWMVKLRAAGWTVAVVMFRVFEGIVLSWGLAAIIAATIWFGDETTCAPGYLLSERAHFARSRRWRWRRGQPLRQSRRPPGCGSRWPGCRAPGPR